MSNQKKHLEEVSQKYPVKNKQKKVVENNVTENRFSAIKRSVKKSKDIDEKIEYLEKECQKTGLNEITMSTIGVYQKPTPVPNQDYNDFESQSQVDMDLDFQEQMVMVRVVELLVQMVLHIHHLILLLE